MCSSLVQVVWARSNEWYLLLSDPGISLVWIGASIRYAQDIGSMKSYSWVSRSKVTYRSNVDQNNEENYWVDETYI